MKASVATRARGDASSHAVRAGGEMRRPLALALALASAAGLVAGSTASELTFENASIGGLTATEKLFRGAVATNDGRITLVPSHAESIVIFDENAESFATVNTGTAANDKYCGGARVSDGRIVFAPFLGRSRVGVFDPSTDTFSEEGTAFLPASSFTGAVVTRDDEVVLVPGENYHKVGIFDPSDNTTREVSIPNTHGGTFRGGALAGDGRVVFTPHNGTSIGVFNSTDDSFILVDIAAELSTSTGQSYFQGAATTRDGRVVFAPHDEDAVGVFDPADESFATVDISSQIDYDGKFSGAVTAGDGRVVFAPHNSDGVGIFDPIDNSFEFISQPSGFTAGTDLALFSGAALTSDGRVVFAPLEESSVGILSGLPDPTFPDHPCLCARSAGFNVDSAKCGANGRGWAISGTKSDCPYTRDTSSAPAATTAPESSLTDVIIAPEVSSLSCAGGEKGLVVFAVVDDDVTDDIPDSPAAIAEGFRNANAHYIGNVALEELNITSAKMCLERSKAGGDARCAKTCVELLESDFEYGGLTPPFSSELKKAIWALTGQVDGHAAGDSDEIFHARKIDWVGDAKTCAATPVGDLCWSCATANETANGKIVHPEAPENWRVAGGGMALRRAGDTNELYATGTCVETAALDSFYVVVQAANAKTMPAFKDGSFAMRDYLRAKNGAR